MHANGSWFFMCCYWGVDLALLLACMPLLTQAHQLAKRPESSKLLCGHDIGMCNGTQMIDEVHTLIGAGAAEGAIDAANILKPALARGELQCIGATTLDEYRKHIEKDPALERRFQPVKMSSQF